MVTVEHVGPVAGLDWTVLRGDREGVFRTLGREHAAAIHAWRDLRGGAFEAHVTRAFGARRAEFEAVRAASEAQLPLESAELGWLASGAGVPADDLWALNLRGDLGRDGTGCSDAAVCAGGSVVLGHNEDGDGELVGSVRLVTLAIDGDPTVTVLWYPGMLPANSFVATSAGLVFGIDHVPVVTPLRGGLGRHLVARHAQRQVSGAAARRVLGEVRCAGGFAFNLADAAGLRCDIIENAGGVVAWRAVGPQYSAHTNHVILADASVGPLAIPAGDRWLAESRTRRVALKNALASGSDAGSGSGLDSGPGSGLGEGPAARILGALRGPGVLNESDDLRTFATLVADLAADRIIVQAAAGPWSGRLSEFAVGNPVSE